MNRLKWAVPLSVAALALAGCTGAGQEPTVTETVTVEPAAPAPETVTMTPEPEPERPTPEAVEAPAGAPDKPMGQSEVSDRGNLVKQPGEQAGLLGMNGEPFVTFTVENITTDQPCTSPYTEQPKNGHFVFLETTVQTSEDLIEEYGSTFAMTYGWKAISSEGETSSAVLDTFAAYSCLPETELLPVEMGPAETATGTIVLDVEDPAGTLIFEDLMFPETGWEWEYGQ